MPRSIAPRSPNFWSAASILSAMPTICRSRCSNAAWSRAKPSEWLSLSVSVLDQRFQIARQRPDLLHAGVERLRQFVDALRERVEAGRAGALRDVVDARAQRLHVAGKRGDAFGRRDARGEFAQLVDRRFEIAQRFGIGRADREAVHLVRQFRYARVEARQAFGRRHRVQALVDFGKVALDRLAAPKDRRRGHSRGRSARRARSRRPAGFPACGAAGLR